MPTRAASAAGAPSESRCALPGWREAERKVWRCWRNPRPCSASLPRCSNAPRHWSNGERRCVAPANAREARRVLSQGLDGAARCGAQPLAARAREELRVAGARPRRDWSVGVEALTPSELRIVRLARDGRTNRQIAQELYVSIKTVEGHLARAYGKLGIASREELDRVLDPQKTRVSTL